LGYRATIKKYIIEAEVLATVQAIRFNIYLEGLYVVVCMSEILDTFMNVSTEAGACPIRTLQIIEILCENSKISGNSSSDKNAK
jgi:hypothetical protein